MVVIDDNIRCPVAEVLTLTFAKSVRPRFVHILQLIFTWWHYIQSINECTVTSPVSEAYWQSENKIDAKAKQNVHSIWTSKEMQNGPVWIGDSVVIKQPKKNRQTLPFNHKPGVTGQKKTQWLRYDMVAEQLPEMRHIFNWFRGRYHPRTDSILQIKTKYNWSTVTTTRYISILIYCWKEDHWNV